MCLLDGDAGYKPRRAPAEQPLVQSAHGRMEQAFQRYTRAHHPSVLPRQKRLGVAVRNYRVPAWMAWRDGMKGLLYWGGMSYWRQTDDPWTQAPFYTGRGRAQQGEKGIVFHGESSLVYPAHAVGYD